MRPLPSLFLAAALLAACAGPPPAPVVDRSAGDQRYETTPDGHYRVRRGDSLYAIAFRYGLDWRDVAHWNGIGAPYVIHPDQLLRLGPPGAGHATPSRDTASGSGASVATTRPATGASGATTRPLAVPRATTSTRDGEQPESAPAVDEGSATSAAPVPVPVPEPDTAATSSIPADARPPAVPTADPSTWLWPAEGRIQSRFLPGDPARKGIDIGGEVGQPIRAAAGGVVVYSGSGLIGYGELIIIKHSDRMLSAYAHNSKRLVSEGQRVEPGGQIAEMGRNDRNQAVLHFEIRVNGSPEDPLKYLPRR